MPKLNSGERIGALITYHLAEFDIDFSELWSNKEFGDGSFEKFSAWNDSRPLVAAQERAYAMQRATYTYTAAQFSRTKDARLLQRLSASAKDCAKAEEDLMHYTSTTSANSGNIYLGSERVG